MKNKVKTLQSTHEKWRHRRKLLTPAFHFKILEDSLKVFNRQSDTCADILSIDSNFGETILDLFPYMTRCTLDIILETAMGQTLDEQVEL
jgi:cytochrome P450 family 4